jgi:SpoVK/Ycf46/Vps4 family AAA+-type ATPase
MRRTLMTLEELGDFGEILLPSEAEEPILAKGVRDALLEWLTEIWAKDELVAVGLKERRRAIFDGAPGTGKTTLAHHLSARLGLPMLVVRPEKIVDCWLGSTGRNIGALFDAARSEENPVVLFLDEFDALASTRRENSRTGAEDERNGWINTLLQRIEQHAGFIITATNHAKTIDPAIWRRFDIHITLELPGQPERERILARYLAPYALPKPALRKLGEALETASPALMRQFAENLKRQLIVGPRVNWDMRRESVIDRLIAANQPHPDLGKPRLWTLGAKDPAIAAMPWPLPKIGEAAAIEAAEAHGDSAENVVRLERRSP